MESGSGTHFRWQGFEIQKVVENVLRRVHGSATQTPAEGETTLVKYAVQTETIFMVLN